MAQQETKKLYVNIPTDTTEESEDKDEHDEHVTKWKTVPNAIFDEIAASIIMNPQVGIMQLKSPLIKRERDGSTLLHLFAGGENCQDLITFFINAGISPDVTDDSGWTPLLEAAQEGQIPNCEVLLQHGATPDLGAEGVTPLKAAVKSGNAEMTQWLLKQRNTWDNQTWDNEFFAQLLLRTPSAATQYLDAFACVQNHYNTRRTKTVGQVAVKYSQLCYIYGEPHVPVDETALGLAVSYPHGKNVLPHRIMKHLMRVKWKSFGKTKFRQEFAVYCTLLASYYLPMIYADPDWVQLHSWYDVWVALSRIISWGCSLYLIIRVEYKEYEGSGAQRYFASFWNWLNLMAYGITLITIPLEFVSEMSEVRHCLLAIITVSLWVNMLQFLQVSTTSGLLLAMMSRMLRDVYRFFLLYVVFLLGYSGAFYILLRGEQGFEDFTNSFLSVFLLLYGQLNYSIFNQTTSWTWYTSNALLMAYLMSAVTVLLNILIAMMASTYADIWAAAEAETLLSHAQAIVRMEKSLSKKTRERKYRQLVGTTKGQNEVEEEEEPSVFAIRFERNASTQRFLSRLDAKRAMVSSIVEKIKNAPAIDQAKQAVENAMSTSPTWSAVRPIVATQAASFQAPNLDALKESLYLKSTFDLDEDEDEGDEQLHGAGHHRKPLGLLEDGIRYEVPEKRNTQNKSNHETLLQELQMQVQQLTGAVLELKAMAPPQVQRHQSRRRSLMPHFSPPPSAKTSTKPALV